MNIKEKLMKQDKFSDSEKELANFILKKKEKVLHMSVQEISQQTYTSTSAVVRLCRKIGLKGFKDFKIQYSAELQQKYEQVMEVDANFPFNEDDTVQEISSKILALTKDSLHETAKLFSAEKLEKAVAYIINSKRTAIFAIGDSFIRALDFQNKMMKINKNILSMQIPFEFGHLAQTLCHEDCAIVISYSGQTKTLIEYVQILKRKLVTIIAITSNEESKIANLSDLVLLIPNKESKSIKFSTFSSQTCIEYYLNILYSYFFVLDFENNHKRRITTEVDFLDTRF